MTLCIWDICPILGHLSHFGTFVPFWDRVAKISSRGFTVLWGKLGVGPKCCEGDVWLLGINVDRQTDRQTMSPVLPCATIHCPRATRSGNVLAHRAVISYTALEIKNNYIVPYYPGYNCMGLFSEWFTNILTLGLCVFDHNKTNICI